MSSQRTHTSMLDDLTAYRIDDAIEAAHVLIPGMRLHPGDCQPVLDTIDAIGSWAHDHKITQLADLTGDTATVMLRELTDTQQLQQIQTTAGGDRLHQTRNALIALRGTTMVARTNHATQRGQRPGNDSLAAGLPTLAKRTHAKGRPLRDDEIMLTRILVEIDLMEDAPTGPIHAYLLAETGLGSIENTQIERDHLNDPHAPTKVTAPGLWNAGPRVVKLDPYVANTLTRTLPRLRFDGNQALSYTGQNVGKDASASLIPVLRRYLARAGITGGDITAKSINLWRPDHLLRNGSLKKAVRVHGRRPAHLLHDLRYTIDESTLYKKKTHILDHEDNIVAAISTWHLTAA